MSVRRISRIASLVGGLLAAALTLTPAAAIPSSPGGCQRPWTASADLVNPEDPGFFDSVDRNGDGVICIKDWTGPDPDPGVGFLAIDNVVRPGR